MICMLKQLTAATLLFLFAAILASAQANVVGKCSGRVYKRSEVAKRAKIIDLPELSALRNVLGPGTRARFVIDAVLCRTGQVTDIRVREGVSDEIDPFAIAAVSTIKFEPAELRWHSVSQRLTYEIRIGLDEETARLVESVDIIGHRRLTTKEIFSWIKTRPGDSYSEEQLKRDFDALLATGYFDKTETRVMTEPGMRGGVRVTFEVMELPAPVVKPNQ